MDIYYVVCLVVVTSAIAFERGVKYAFWLMKRDAERSGEALRAVIRKQDAREIAEAIVAQAELERRGGKL